MKTIVIIIIILVIAAGLYFLLKPEEDIMSDPRIDKFAKIQAEIEIEAERFDHDSILMDRIEDSIYEHYDVSEQWVNQVRAVIDEHQKWVDVYQLMIDHAEYIKDSLMHRR
ncbi:MAG: hypothetical protein GWO28_02035, partial [candidate division Zixibacteria bacterium]|nr:hypothetical protein [candidate division Zixibacteria bacterium]